MTASSSFDAAAEQPAGHLNNRHPTTSVSKVSVDQVLLLCYVSIRLMTAVRCTYSSKLVSISDCDHIVIAHNKEHSEVKMKHLKCA